MGAISLKMTEFSVEIQEKDTFLFIKSKKKLPVLGIESEEYLGSPSHPPIHLNKMKDFEGKKLGKPTIFFGDP
jgi:hypothetical protein